MFAGAFARTGYLGKLTKSGGISGIQAMLDWFPLI